MRHYEAHYQSKVKLGVRLLANRWGEGLLLGDKGSELLRRPAFSSPSCLETKAWRFKAWLCGFGSSTSKPLLMDGWISPAQDMPVSHPRVLQTDQPEIREGKLFIDFETPPPEKRLILGFLSTPLLPPLLCRGSFPCVSAHVRFLISPSAPTSINDFLQRLILSAVLEVSLPLSVALQIFLPFHCLTGRENKHDLLDP